jgi:hypothetical protein
MSDVNQTAPQSNLVIMEMDGDEIISVTATEPGVRVMVVNYDMDGVPEDEVAVLRRNTGGAETETECTITEYTAAAPTSDDWEQTVVDAWQRRYGAVAAALVD